MVVRPHKGYTLCLRRPEAKRLPHAHARCEPPLTSRLETKRTTRVAPTPWLTSCQGDTSTSLSPCHSVSKEKRECIRRDARGNVYSLLWLSLQPVIKT